MTQTDLFPAIPTEVSARIDKALDDGRLTGCARAVLVILAARPAVGRNLAISIADLQRVFRCHVNGQSAAGREYSDRDIKGAVKELIEEFGVPVGSSRQEPYGYFLCASPEDREAAVKPIRAETLSLLKRWRVLDAKSDIGLELAGQLRMQETGGEAA